MSVEGRTAIVTGAATGIGRATARLLAERGARVVAAGLQPDELAGTVQAIAEAGGEAIAVDADLSDPDAIEAVAAAAQTAFGGADILVNNAAVYPLGPWHEMDAAALDAVFATNVRGYYLMARAVREQMIARGGGAVVNVASVTFSGQRAPGGVRRLEGRRDRLHARARARGGARRHPRQRGRSGRLPHGGDRDPRRPGGLWRDVLEAQSIKRRGEVEDVARAIAFFASDDASFVSGQTLLVDGGWMRG